jgi:hypothetical protein
MSDHEDDLLMARLRGLAAEADPVPDEVLAAARDAYGLRTLDAELAELVADSLDTAGAVRGAADVRLLSFESGSVTVELEVTPVGPRRRLLGELVGGVGPVRLETPSGSSGVELDVAGRFVADVPGGPVRLLCTGPDGVAVATSWTVL